MQKILSDDQKLSQEKLMSYGEAYTHTKVSLTMVKGEWVSVPIPKHKSKMQRSEAMKYYTSKFNDYFQTDRGV